MELQITNGIVSGFMEKLTNASQVDVAIAGGGPSGLVAGYHLVRKGYTVALFESRLAPGGGMWGGAMMFSKIMVQKKAAGILSEFGISSKSVNEGMLEVDSVEATSALINKAAKTGVSIFNCITVEDVMMNAETKCINGIVINWNAVRRLEMHVDPLMIKARAVLDGTGHPSEIAAVAARKNNITLETPTGTIAGEMSLDAAEGEKRTVEHTGMIYPGLFVSGMASNAVHGAFRMGPIFGGMLLSGVKAADEIERFLTNG